jgi:hypothetical protein
MLSFLEMYFYTNYLQATNSVSVLLLTIFTFSPGK